MQVLITGNPWLDMVFSTHGLAIIGILVALWLMRSKVVMCGLRLCERALTVLLLQRNVPGPRGLPIIGNALEVAAQRATFLDWLWKLHKKVHVQRCRRPSYFMFSPAFDLRHPSTAPRSPSVC